MYNSQVQYVRKYTQSLEEHIIISNTLRAEALIVSEQSRWLQCLSCAVVTEVRKYTQSLHIIISNTCTLRAEATDRSYVS